MHAPCAGLCWTQDQQRRRAPHTSRSACSARTCCVVILACVAFFLLFREAHKLPSGLEVEPLEATSLSREEELLLEGTRYYTPQTQPKVCLAHRYRPKIEAGFPCYVLYHPGQDSHLHIPNCLGFGMDLVAVQSHRERSKAGRLR